MDSSQEVVGYDAISAIGSVVYNNCINKTVRTAGDFSAFHLRQLRRQKSIVYAKNRCHDGEGHRLHDLLSRRHLAIAAGLVTGIAAVGFTVTNGARRDATASGRFRLTMSTLEIT
jgi:hypothetical protein